jgi:UDP-N-acetylglucosamine--N-acetylmuramyl-(pentapeptide) pyrophosphoryl-undecaprenol N-acetylglucosamine transferase
MRRPLRFIFYAVNGLGLGHVVRLLAIARKLRARAKDAEILFVTSSEADSVIYREGFAALKVPSKNVRVQVGLPKEAYLKLVQTVVWNAVSSFSPDVLVVDTFPTGNLQELAPLLTWEMRKVFVFREQKEEMARRPLLQNAIKLYDRVIVPHDEAEDLPLPEGVRAFRVGPILIRDRGEVLSREEARQRLGLAGDRTVLYASFGGGGDPEVDRCLRLTLRLALEHSDLEVVLAPGPLYRAGVGSRRGGEMEALLGRLGGRVRVLDYFPAMEVLHAFDLAVAGVGYNTSHELLYTGVPAVFIPFPRVLDDQGARARWIATNEAGVTVPVPDLESLREALGRLLQPGTREAVSRRARRLVPENGAGRAAQEILAVAGE